MRFRRLSLLFATMLAAALVPLVATAAPTCTVEGTEAACGDRVVAEPLNSATFLQYGTEFPAVLEAVQRIAPDFVDVYALDELTGDPAHVSYGGRTIWVVRVTDESVAGPKKDVVASLGVHGNESAGREGGIRYIEDLARWWVDDPERLLYAGDQELPLSEVFAEVEAWFGFTNPDGWAAGDVTDPSGVGFWRGNGNHGGGAGAVLGGVDLNREFPTLGWTNLGATPLSEPEAKGWSTFVESLDLLTTATDIHGELTSATNSWADLMWPAGQWSPTRQAQELQLAQNMTRTIERKFEDDPKSLQTILTHLHGSPVDRAGIATKPADFATAYDIVGYDDGGFMGDYFVTQGAVEVDVENFLSHLVPNNAWVGVYEQAHVIAVRGILESIITEAVITDDVRPALDLGRVAYVDDPARVTSADGLGAEPPAEYADQQRDYDVSRLDYFGDLAADAGTAIPAVDAASIAAGSADLHELDTLVVADEAFPAGDYDRAAYLSELRGFAEAGGQLLLTDRAVTALADLGLVEHGAVRQLRTNAGHIDFGETDHRWENGLVGVPSQTYYEVPLGFAPEDDAPHYGVVQGVWETLDGATTVGTVSAGGTTVTALGEIALGAGSVAIFGAILPTPTEKHVHVYGLVSYGVTVAGGEVLHTILEYERPAEVSQTSSAAAVTADEAGAVADRSPVTEEAAPAPDAERLLADAWGELVTAVQDALTANR